MRLALPQSDLNRAVVARAQGIRQGVFVATIGTNYNLVVTHKAAYVLGTSAALNSRLL